MDVASKLRDFEQACRSHGLPITIQRRAILEAIAAREDHPTADQIYEEVRTRLPDVSRATVYRVLDTLVRLDVVRRASHPDAVARFDPNTTRHHHLVCLKCRHVQQISHDAVKELFTSIARDQHFQVETDHLALFGYCEACQREQRPKSSGAKRGRASTRPGGRAAQAKRA